MGLFDSMLRGAAKNAANQAVSSAVNNAVSNAVQNAQNKTEKFTFHSVPETPEQLLALPEGNLDSPFKTTALTLLALLQYEKSPETCHALLNALRGPDPMSGQAEAFIRDRIKGREYTVRSFFAGATVQNNYTPTAPLVIEVSQTPYSYPEENWATMYVKSSGADSPRPIKLRRKPSTNQWFLNDIQCLSEIRAPAASDPWA